VPTQSAQVARTAGIFGTTREFGQILPADLADEVFEQGVRAIAPIACAPVMDGRHAPRNEGQ